MMDYWKIVVLVEIYEFEYENLVIDLEGESCKLIEYIGLDWDLVCLEFYKSDN